MLRCPPAVSLDVESEPTTMAPITPTTSVSSAELTTTRTVRIDTAPCSSMERRFARHHEASAASPLRLGRNSDCGGDEIGDKHTGPSPCMLRQACAVSTKANADNDRSDVK